MSGFSYIPVGHGRRFLINAFIRSEIQETLRLEKSLS